LEFQSKEPPKLVLTLHQPIKIHGRLKPCEKTFQRLKLNQNLKEIKLPGDVSSAWEGELMVQGKYGIYGGRRVVLGLPAGMVLGEVRRLSMENGDITVAAGTACVC
jgi:hypothetical protein